MSLPTESQLLTGARAQLIARNELAQCQDLALKRPSDALNIVARRMWETANPAQTWVQISFNRRGGRGAASGSSMQGNTHSVGWPEWQLAERLHKAWCAGSSSAPEFWTRGVPSYGQAAVTALLVQDVLGGELATSTAISPYNHRSAHFANLVEGKVRDFARLQFSSGATFLPFSAISREQLLSDPETAKRYALLKHRYRRVVP